MKPNKIIVLVGGVTLILGLPLDGNFKSEIPVRHNAEIAAQMDYPRLKRHLGDRENRESDTEDKSHEWNRDLAVEDGARWTRRSPDKTPDDKWPRTPNPEDSTAGDVIWGRDAISNLERQEVSPDSTTWDDKRDARVMRLPPHDGKRGQDSQEKRANGCRGDRCKRQGQHQTHGQGENDWGKRGGPYHTDDKLEKKVREAGDSGGPWERSVGESVPDWDN